MILRTVAVRLNVEKPIMMTNIVLFAQSVFEKTVEYGLYPQLSLAISRHFDGHHFARRGTLHPR